MVTFCVVNYGSREVDACHLSSHGQRHGSDSAAMEAALWKSTLHEATTLQSFCGGQSSTGEGDACHQKRLAPRGMSWLILPHNGVAKLRGTTHIRS